MRFDLALDETRTSGPVKLIFRRLALLERTEANLAKEPLPDDVQPCDGWFLACEVAAWVAGKYPRQDSNLRPPE